MNIKQQLITAYQQIRQQTETICQPLLIEDYVIQSIDDVSPPKWHLAHTTWFFETFILSSQVKNYQPFHPSFQYLFNSYYQTLGLPYPRIRRGVLSRPTVETIYQYRQYVDENMLDFIENLSHSSHLALESTLTLGLQHEQQHQELLLMDIKHNFSLDPNFPAYHTTELVHGSSSPPMQWIEIEGGMIEIGNNGEEFCFDNELPRHQIILKPYLLANRLVTNAEYLEFIEAGGYKNPIYWLADGWDNVQKHHCQAPLYWFNCDNKWYVFTLSGAYELNLAEPVSHVSYYEADAFARWRGLRLPSEGEWEHFIVSQQLSSVSGNFLEEKILHPRAIKVDQLKNHAYQLFGDVWEWTASAYSPYPGYKPLDGSLGEYNGKFMSNQFVLRGGSCVTPRSHIRASYRNFFQPDKRWQFSGIRLANNVFSMG